MMPFSSGMYPVPKKIVVVEEEKKYRYEDNYGDIFDSGYWQLTVKYELNKRANFQQLQEDIVFALAKILKQHGITQTTSGVESYKNDPPKEEKE